MDSPQHEQTPVPHSENKPSRIRTLYSKDPFEDISFFTGYPEGTLITPFKLKLGPIDQFHPFQLSIINAMKSGDISAIKRSANNAINTLESLGVNIKLFNTAEQLIEHFGSEALGYSKFKTTYFGPTKPTEIGLLTPKAYALEYSSTPLEGEYIFAQKVGHEAGHAMDKLLRKPGIIDRVDYLINTKIPPARQAPSFFKFHLETEARQKFFNAVAYTSINQLELAQQYFAIAQGLIGDTHLFSTARSLVRQYREK